MAKAQELRDLSVEELQTKLEDLQKQVYELRSERLDSKTQKTHLIGASRKEIAQIKTVMRQKDGV
ncbi:MAG: hypothetical protein S4CHLAM45_12890 [Chlamydiales bacterium]|nr:hypothetical protein [Chlamydiales bacterium]MCH9619778.1 hypothetical protein [Chlamydiales bacterium]MCH9623384.1 hypothetical protein [Chlamydiales bacterium]